VKAEAVGRAAIWVVVIKCERANYTLVTVRVNLVKFEAGAKELPDYAGWFRAQVQAAIDDPRPSIPDAKVRAKFAAKREALRARSISSH
jgi:hypothetical protein